MSNFDDAFNYTMDVEKGYTVDNGGETMYGITIAVARANGYTGNMKELPLDVAKKIAKTCYWDKFHCDQMPAKIAFQVFDTAYNGGYPIKWLQQSLNITADGIFGKETLDALNTCKDNIYQLIIRFNSYRLDYLSGLKVLPTYASGWIRRIATNLRIGAE